MISIEKLNKISDRDIWNKCEVCGKFIPFEDFHNGRAYHQMILPDSDLSNETWETLCYEHNNKK